MAKISNSINMRRLLCPMPVIRTQQAVKKLQIGDVLEIICTDPGTLHDIPTWCRMYGHTILRAEQVEQDFIFNIEVATEQEAAQQSSDWD